MKYRTIKKYCKFPLKNKRNKRKTIKNKGNWFRGGNNNETVLCCMCENIVNKKDTLRKSVV